MSWSFPPAHVVQDTGAGSTTSHTPTPPSSVLFMVCSGFHCLTNDSFDGATTPLIADALAALGDVYDWYTVTIRVDFPAVDQGSVVCGHTPFALCPGDDIASSSGSVNFDLVKQADGTSFATSGSASAAGHATAPPWTIGGDSLATVDRSLLVNPTPSFPVPDAAGNTSGRVLWTREELLAAAANTVDPLLFSWAYVGIRTTSNIGVWVSIDAYLNVPPPPPPEGGGDPPPDGVADIGDQVVGVVRFPRRP